MVKTSLVLGLSAFTAEGMDSILSEERRLHKLRGTAKGKTETQTNLAVVKSPQQEPRRVEGKKIFSPLQ